MRDEGNLIQLYALRFFFHCWSFWDFIRTTCLYYSDPLFRKVDFALLRSYWWNNPYVISRRFLEQKGESEVHAYGETPVSTIDLIARECRLTSSDTIYELGCGRGRGCFWLAICLKAQVIGIDFVPTFIETAKGLASRYVIKNLTFYCEDFLKASFDKATVYYLHGTCMPERDIICLMERLSKAPQGTRVITVSFSLSDYPAGKLWKIDKCFKAPFSWGSTDVYLHIKR